MLQGSSTIVGLLLCFELVQIFIFANSCCKAQQSNDYVSGYIIKMRGLPWSTTVEDIKTFFSGCNIKNDTLGIHIVMTKEGRPSGEAYVEMESEEDTKFAVAKDQEYLDNRYIEVFHAQRSEMEKAVRRSILSIQRALNDGCIRLRGLPFKCPEEDIINFFKGLDIVPRGITFVMDRNGRSTGEAYVQFRNKELAEKALLKHKDTLFHRYIEVFRSSVGEVRLAKLNQKRAMLLKAGGETSNGSTWEGHTDFPLRNHMALRNNKLRSAYRSGWYGETVVGHQVRMRGLPFRASQMEIVSFFSPVKPVNIRMIYDVNGRPSGEAVVEFSSKVDALRAMSKHKTAMQHRYIELFLKDVK